MQKSYFFLITMFVILLIPNVYAQSSSEDEDLPGEEIPPVAEEAPGRAENLPGEEVAPGEETPPGLEDVGRAGEDEDLPEEITEDATEEETTSGGGCLIATATYGTELSPQVQQLREIRDNQLLQTESGSAFMESFNQFYYSFSPGIADLERENPIFKEVVKLTITPLLTSLSILNYVDIDSEAEMIGYGISLILMNVGMYFVAPAIVIIQLKKRF